MDNTVKITGFKRTVGTYNGKEFDNVRVQTVQLVTPLNPRSTDYVDKATKQVVGSGVTSGSWLLVEECKIRTADALDIFCCDTFEELLKLRGKHADLTYNRYGSLVTATIEKE